MELISLDTIIKNLYQNNADYIRIKNMELERNYFSNPHNRIPMDEIMQGKSYEDHFLRFKEAVKSNNEYEISQIFTLLQEYFLFSAGYDMMFKMKLKADIFVSTPMEDFLYPMFLEAIHEKYNDISVMEENPNFETNKNGIQRIKHVYDELQSLLYLLYYYDFQFPDDWENAFPDTHEELIEILNASGMTIGDFREALINSKCQIMQDIMREIPDFRLRMYYLKRIAELKKEKQADASKFADAHLPITYFLNHTILDALKEPPRSSIILGNENPKKAPKILLPTNFKH